MFKLAIISVLVFTVSGQSQYAPQNYGSQSLTTPAPVHPAAQVHYVNIGQDLAGDYKFGYDTGKGPLGQSFREETRGPDGTVKGAYGYIDANGEQRIVKYTAGKAGFQIDSDNPAPKAQNHMAAASPPRAQPAPQYQQFPAAAPRAAAMPQIPAAPAALPQNTFTGVPQIQGNPSLQYRPAQVPAYNAPQQGLQQNAAVNNPALQYLINSRLINPGLAAHNNPSAGIPQPQPIPQALPQSLPQSYAPQPAPQYRPAAPAYQPRPAFTTANSPSNTVQGTPLSAFPQLPGVRLIEVQPRRGAPYAPAAAPAAQSANVATNSFQNSFSSSSLGANSYGGASATGTTPEPEYTGPVVINAALLSYDIGTQGQRRGQ